MDRVAQRTGNNWETVFRMTAVEWFGVIRYIQWDDRRVEENRRRYLKKH